MPDVVASLAKELWVRAVDTAHATLEDDRRDLEQQRQSASRDIDAARTETEDAIQQNRELEHALALAQETIGGRNTAIRRLEQELAEAKAALTSKDERILGLAADLNRRDQEASAVHAQLDALRKHSLLQLDEARGEGRHWKSELDRTMAVLCKARDKAGTLEVQSAESRGRAEGLEQALVNAREQIRQFEERARTASLEEIRRPAPSSNRSESRGRSRRTVKQRVR